MLYVVVDGSRAEVVRAWLVPSAILDAKGFEVSTKDKHMLRFQASAKPGAKDMWRPYRLERDELVPALVKTVKSLENSDG
jgi:hypothetical protein